MNLTTTDLTDFLLLPETVRTEVESWHSRFQTQITPPIQRALEGIAQSMGSTYSTARRKYDAWRKSGWRGLINRSKVRETGGALNPEFIDFWKKLCEQNGRKCYPAYREFVRRFKSGDPIPGLEPNVPRGSLPLGFSYDNLMRHAPTKFELTASRIGRSAAAPFRPKLLTTRVGLHVGQYLVFDDLWHDFKVVSMAQRRAMRLLQLHAHDLFSGCQFARGLKARMEDPETGKSVNLNQDEMLFLVAHVLSAFGYYREGCVLMVEHGTAAIPEWLEKLLFDLTNGLVTVDRSGIEGASSFAGQYAGRGKGNFRFKAALESLGNLIHNETANLLNVPGQTGSNSRINAPEELAGREKHNDALALAIVDLAKSHSPLASKLRLPFLEVNYAKWVVEEIMERINQRTVHDLEGWEQCGLTTFDFQIPGLPLIPSSAYENLPADHKARIDAVSEPVPRKMSPREVFDAGRSDLVRFRPEQTAYLLKDRHGREVSVGNDYMITFEDSAISPEPLRYKAHHFPPGEKFLAVVNPWAPEDLHLFDVRGRWVGQVETWQRIRRDDVAALHRQMGESAKVEKELLAPLAARGAELTAKRLEDSRHNIGAIKGTAAKQAAASADAQSALMQSML